MTEESQSKVNISETDGDKKDHEILKELCEKNAEYFSKDSSENGQRLYISFLSMRDNIDLLLPSVVTIHKAASQFDFDENTPGNGYRSFTKVYDSAVAHGLQLNKKISSKRDSVLFRKAVITKELEACAQLFASLNACFKYLENVYSWEDNEGLFGSEKRSVEALFDNTSAINQYCFYGRCLGFQFCDSMKSVLKFIAISIAIFSEAYYSEGSMLSKATNSVFTTTKYIIDPEYRAKRIVNISQNADVNFCKSFWFLSETELMSHVPSVVADNVAISKIISIPPEPLTLTVDGKEIDVPIPNAHIGTKPIQVRLICHEVREGMIGEANRTRAKPPSRGLLIHCHGGGFVAQSSKSHESYLRQWAKELQVPIMSVDYSLAPEAPFPRALEEVMYAYCWALKNHELLGSTGERIVFAGDSAGANLLLSTCVKCLELNVPPPVGIFAAYAPTLINFIPSPGRLLCMMDPLLPFGFMMRCLKAYVVPYFYKELKNGNKSDTESFEEISESDLVELQAHKSPTSEASDTTLTYSSLGSQAEESKEPEVVKEKPSVNGTNGNLMSDFLEKYVLDSDTDTDGNRIPVLSKEDISVIPSEESVTFQNKVSTFITSLRGKLENLVPKPGPSGAMQYLDTERENNFMDEFRFSVPRNPYLSPYCAPDEILKKFPPVNFLTVHMDPFLDDCVMYAKKLKKLGNTVHLDILDGLPHGFLNFSLVSKEAQDGCKFCIQRMSELFSLESLPPLDT